jgi:hypothetical protein
MKKILLMLAIASALFACQKEELQPQAMFAPVDTNHYALWHIKVQGDAGTAYRFKTLIGIPADSNEWVWHEGFAPDTVTINVVLNKLGVMPANPDGILYNICNVTYLSGQPRYRGYSITQEYTDSVPATILN